MSSGAVNSNRLNAPQAFVSSYAPRVRTYGNSLLTPVVPQTILPPVRTTKRGTTAINYAEEFDDDSIDDSDGPRRATGLRTAQQRREPDPMVEKAKELGKEIHAPVDVQGIWRDWMGKPKRVLTERQMHVQSALPTTLIPIKIDLDVAPFRPEAALPTPGNAKDFGIDENLPAYKAPEPTPPFRLKDQFLWNLHEALITPDMFAKTFVDELDFPVMRKQAMVMEIAQQIRIQLEENAATALHPLFQPEAVNQPPPTTAPTPSIRPAISREDSSTPMQADTPSAGFLQLPQTNGHQLLSDPPTPMPNGTSTPALAVTAQPLPRDPSASSALNPPDTHRCLITLSINLQNRLYTDKFEWSLLHPPGFPEIFARQTCADLGLPGEWVPMMAHAIYESSLRLKKDMIDNNGTLAGVVGSGVDGWGVIENEACEYHGTAESAIGVGAGWRFDEDGLGVDWEPKIEVLSKEEIERREGDRERQIRRQRRETARFTSTYPLQAQSTGLGDYFSGGLGSSQQANGAADDERMGRGERSKKKRRFRSLSPVGRDTPDVAGFGGTTSQLSEGERGYWACSHCCIWGSAVWGVRDGPNGPRVSGSNDIFQRTILTNLACRHYAPTAASSTSVISASHPGTTASSTTKRTKRPEKPTSPNTTKHRPYDKSPTSNPILPPFPNPLLISHHASTNVRRTSTLRPISTLAHRPAAKVRSPQAPWPTSSTTPNPARTLTGPKSPSRASESVCRISSTGASIVSAGSRLRAMVAVGVIIPVLRVWDRTSVRDMGSGSRCNKLNLQDSEARRSRTLRRAPRVFEVANPGERACKGFGSTNTETHCICIDIECIP